MRAATTTLAAIAMAITGHTPDTHAKTRPTASKYPGGCNTRACLRRSCDAACRERVRAKVQAQRPYRPAVASWYGPGFYGNTTACGQTLTPGMLGVAHKTLPCGTPVRVCLRGCATVPVIDRGPFVAGRELDLTEATARTVGLAGVATVRARVGG